MSAFDSILQNLLALEIPPDRAADILKGFAGAGGLRERYAAMWEEQSISSDKALVERVSGLVAVDMAAALAPIQKWIDVHSAMARGDHGALLQETFPWLYGPPDRHPGIEFQHPHIPEDALRDVWDVLQLRPDQMDTIMSLVSCAENGSSRYWDFYNYIEWGDDHATRGFTTTIFGATSGTGSLAAVFRHLKEIDPTHPLMAYYDASQSSKGGDVSGLEGLAHVDGDHTRARPDWNAYTPNGRTHLDHIRGDLATLSNEDEAWRLAVWRAFYELNLSSSALFCEKRAECEDRPGPPIVSALGKGIIIDTSLNHGDCRWWKDSSTWTRVFDEMGDDASLSDEGAWLRAFLEARKRVLQSGFAHLDWSKSGSRCDIWLRLLDETNLDLERPIQIARSTAVPYPIWQDGLVLE